jgi:hypothetical protein
LDVRVELLRLELMVTDDMTGNSIIYCRTGSKMWVVLSAGAVVACLPIATQSVDTCVPTRSVGTRIRWAARILAVGPLQ